MKKQIAALLLLSICISSLSSCVITPAQSSEQTRKDDMSSEEKTYLTLKKSDLSPLVQNIFDGDEVSEETVMFIDYGDTKELLFPIDEIIAVTSYSNPDALYEEGQDYTVDDGKLHIPIGSRIKCITSEKFYNVESDMLKTEYNAADVNTLYSEGQGITDYQIKVSYKHSASWEGFRQKSSSGIYSDLLGKLNRGEDITLIFFGDSITWGASSSFSYGYEPFGKPFSLLFTEAIADLFGYTVNYIDYSNTLSSSGANPPKPPAEAYSVGKSGTITYINTSMGGWSSADACKNYEAFLQQPIEEYGCDLLVLGFGMNDGYPRKNFTKDNLAFLIEAAKAMENDLSVMLIATMIPNPNATNGWSSGQEKQEPELEELAADYTDRGTPAAAVNMASVSLALYKRKDFIDCTGNNINHPNDFMMRIYAITMIEALIGYENIT